MTDYFNLLPSEISGLVLGFLRDSNCVIAAGAFLRENVHLSEFRYHYASVNEIPLYFRELTLLDIIHDYIHIVNEVIPHLKKANLPWQLGNLNTSIAQFLQSFPETCSSNLRPKSFRPIHPVWMPLGKSYVPPKIIPADKSTTVRPPLATVKPNVTIASLPNIISSNSTSGIGAGTVCSLDNNSTGSRASRPVLRIYRQPLAANKTNVFNFDMCSSSFPNPSSHQASQSNIVASKSNANPMQSMVRLQNKTKRVSETLPTTTTVTSNGNSDVLSLSTSCNSVIFHQSPISITTSSEGTMNDATVQSIGVINQNENITSQQICLNAQSNDISDHQQISDNSSIFSVFSLLPPPASSETLVTDMVIYPVITCEDNLNDAKSTDLVSTRRKRNQPPRQLSPGSGVGSTIFSLTNSYEEELDMERFLSALFNNAEQVATRINAEVGILTRNPLSYNDNSNRCNWPETTNTYEIVSIHPSNNNDNNKIVNCSLDNNQSQPLTTNTSSSSSLSSTGVKLSTSFVCQDFNSDTSDNMQLWNDWFGIKGDLDTCIDHLLSDLESIDVFTSTVNTTTVTNTTSTVSSTIPNQNVNNTTIIETLIDIDQCSHQSSVVTTSSNDIITSGPSNVSHELISSPSSSLSDCVINVTVNDKTLAMSITSATITSTSDLFHPNSPILSTLLCDNTGNNSSNDDVNNNNDNNESLIIPSIPDTNLMMKTPIISTPVTITTSTVTNQHLVHNVCKRLITSLPSSSSSPFCFSQLVNNNSQNFPSKRQCLRHSDNVNNINNSTMNINTNNNLPPILITPDSKKNHVNEHNDKLFYENLPSCKLFKGNTNKDSFQHHSNDHHLQSTYLLSSPSCYYSIPQNSNAQTVISSATNTCMTAYLLNNPLSIIDLRQIAQNNNNNTGITITNENNYNNPITFYTTNNNHKLLSSTIENHVNYVDLNNNSLINLIPVSYNSNLTPFIMNNTLINTTLSTITMTTDSNMTSKAFVNLPCNTVSTCTTTTSNNNNNNNNTGSTTDVVTAAVITTGISGDYIQTIKVGDNNSNRCYSKSSLLIDAKENHPPTPALIVQRGVRKKILNLQSLDIEKIISQSH
ncbi:hypothetical protein MS3_00009002 [Schistosoma haematobium]|uniref:Uncharacterized protein n=2 Tax=Schistosoma haematobium TaxID=6185 RepID=A0A922IIM5_SCHHA|nr:hypothetical protein MS3_00009002 [Schistosoma haematobium]KAH9580316.1 hypothetical protein MS3_00009002 [Schistosoma haematobium]CAH8609441.1 unnamed protein product [Schistosoma haematobium]